MNLILEAKAENEAFIRNRRWFHQHPEVSGKEKETSAYAAEELRRLGFEVAENVYGYGVVGVLHGAAKGKAVALRADMDALSIEEVNETPYRSQNPGVMHACGHDSHMAALLGAAHLLASHQAELRGTVKLLFQPAEELSPVGGSRGMIAAGALEGVDAVFGMHVWPDLPHGTVGIKSGALMGASDHFIVTIHGKSSHAARPEMGIDAVLVGTQFVQELQSIVSRQISPLASAVITIGQFHAGTRYNIIADTCRMEGTCRTLDEKVRDYIEKHLRTSLEHVCSGNGATGEFEYQRGYMAVVNDAAMTAHVRKTAVSLFGEGAVEDIQVPSMCGEDFAFYLKEKPGAFFWLGTAKEGTETFPLHNSRFDVDEDILWRGAALLAQTAVDFLNENA